MAPRKKTKACECCGEQFHPDRSTSKYCSRSCSSSTTRNGSKFTIAEIIQKLDDVIVEFSKEINKGEGVVHPRYLWFGSLIEKTGITKDMMDHYKNHYPNQDIIDRINKLRNMQEHRLAEGAIDKRSYVDSGVALKILAGTYGWKLDPYKERELDLKERALDAGIGDTDVGNQKLEVEFTLKEHRSDKDIEAILNDEG